MDSRSYAVTTSAVRRPMLERTTILARTYVLTKCGGASTATTATSICLYQEGRTCCHEVVKFLESIDRALPL